MNKLPKIYLGPMSVNVVDAAIDCNINEGKNFGFIPSRRQVENNGGYVNNWTTKDFSKYVKSRSSKTIIKRDHGGPGQGNIDDDGLDSIKSDLENFDFIHIDPWKKYHDFKSGINQTIKIIEFCSSLNEKIKFEVGTEEAIKRFEIDDIKSLLDQLHNNLPEDIFSQIIYVVVQSGVGLDLGNMVNKGSYNPNRLEEMVKIVNDFGKFSKEHNGDYLTPDQIEARFSIGLDSINIAPELGQIETCAIIELFNDTDKFFNDELFNICLQSNRWKKWVSKEYDPFLNKIELIKICGHYIFSDRNFIILMRKFASKNKLTLDDISKKLQSNIKHHLLSISSF